MYYTRLIRDPISRQFIDGVLVRDTPQGGMNVKAKGIKGVAITDVVDDGTVVLQETQGRDKWSRCMMNPQT